ncbi:DUF2190 family protein [Citromicrobium bathyomarinum]|uniref:DUF2190 family protein n=1 Tax=Citromicrobium bathyomarinum TaxID=72174 RepID=UPI00315A0FA0
MAYFRSPAKIVDLTAPSGGVTVGLFYLIGAVLVCANVTAAEGETFAGVTEGLFDDAAKATGSAWTEGAKLYWDDTNSRFTTSASGNTLVGYAGAAAASGATTGSVVLTGQIAA